MELWCLMPLSNIISVISWQSVLLVEETGIPRNLPQVAEKLYHTMLYLVHLAISWIQTHNFSGDEENSHVSVFVVYILKLEQFVFIGIERFSQNDSLQLTINLLCICMKIFSSGLVYHEGTSCYI